MQNILDQLKQIKKPKPHELMVEKVDDQRNKIFCTCCKVYKKYFEFNKSKIRKNGLQVYCRECNKNLKKKYSSENPWIASFYSAKQRCENENDKSYKWYGGKGIKFICDIEDFKNAWISNNAHLLICPTIDRINPNGNYEPKNIRFIELEENSRRASFGRRKTHCKNGHELKFENLYFVNSSSQGKIRGCRKCRIIRGRIADAKRRKK